MRVLIGLITPGQAGGIRATEERFIAECGRRGVRVATFEYGGRSPSERLYHKLGGRLVDWIQYIRLVRRERPDVVQLNSALTRRALLRDMGYAALSRLMGARLFIKMHGTDAGILSEGGAFWKWAVRFVVRNTRGIGLLSEEERQNFLRAGFSGRNLHVVKNVVDWQRFHRENGECERPPSPLKLLFIARFIPAKGLLDVLEAIRIVLDRGKDVCIDCVGDGPQGVEARDRANALKITDKVTFTGYIPEAETPRHYKCADVLVFPTYHQEGFPMTVFQSAAAGLGIITTRVRASADYLREPEHCLWVEPRNPAMLAEKILFLMDHPDVLASMVRNNKQLAMSFSTEKVTDEYLKIFSSISEAG
ncbi:glycosyltransferase [bacterium]|nr:MAG: glycosyltransferase [bacterium]